MDNVRTFGDLYQPAMAIVTQAEADAYFEWLVHYQMERNGISRETAERTQRINLGYWAGYYDHSTRLRVEALFRTVHPVLGAAADGELTPEQVFRKGVEWGEANNEYPG